MPGKDEAKDELGIRELPLLLQVITKCHPDPSAGQLPTASPHTQSSLPMSNCLCTLMPPPPTKPKLIIFSQLPPPELYCETQPALLVALSPASRTLLGQV